MCESSQRQRTVGKRSSGWLWGSRSNRGVPGAEVESRWVGCVHTGVSSSPQDRQQWGGGMPATRLCVVQNIPLYLNKGRLPHIAPYFLLKSRLQPGLGIHTCKPALRGRGRTSRSVRPAWATWRDPVSNKQRWTIEGR